MATRATIAGATPVIATRSTVTSIGSTIRRTSTGFTAGAEIAEFTGKLGIERIVEADGNRTVTSRDRLSSANGGRGSCGSR